MPPSSVLAINSSPLTRRPLCASRGMESLSCATALSSRATRPSAATPRPPGRVSPGRAARYGERLAQLEQRILQEPDDRVRLMFTCCHPALSRAAQVALTLRAVCGFTTPEIAHAFLVSEAAVAQRIVRARRKIVAAHIPYRMPSDDEMGERLREVLAVLYLMFNEGYLASSGATPTRRDLAEDAAWLTALVARHMPGEPEPLGLLGLIRL